MISDIVCRCDDSQDREVSVDQDEMDLKKVYAIMRDICRLKREWAAA